MKRLNVQCGQYQNRSSSCTTCDTQAANAIEQIRWGLLLNFLFDASEQTLNHGGPHLSEQQNTRQTFRNKNKTAGSNYVVIAIGGGAWSFARVGY